MEKVAVIIPALNEAGNIIHLLNEVKRVTVPGAEISVVLVDNGSSDTTSKEASEAGARVFFEDRRGYGYACAAGVGETQEADILVFLDGDCSFLPSDMPGLLRDILSKSADMVVGSRELGRMAPGAMPLHQRIGNRLAVGFINWVYRLSLTDLGPYRAIRRELLLDLDMQEMTYGWPTEMIVKAARRNVRITEIPVSYQNRRAGQSKVSGTLRGTILAAWFIVGVALRYAWGGVTNDE